MKPLPRLPPLPSLPTAANGASFFESGPLSEKKQDTEKECSKITAANEHRKSKEVFQQICKVKGQSIHIQNQCVKNKEGKTLTEKEEILSQWHNYGKELFDIGPSCAEPNLSTPDIEPGYTFIYRNNGSYKTTEERKITRTRQYTR